jgi:16S rRNA (guanine527-N7)-methyltransferase
MFHDLHRGLLPEVRERLETLATRFGLPAASVASFERLLIALAEDPYAPTSVADPDRAIDVHIADSLSVLRVPGFRAVESVVDIGAGAGFPGFVLAMAMPEARVDLVESSRRKCAFLDRVTARLELENVRVVCLRAEEWGIAEGADSYSLAVARAVGKLATLVEYAAPLLHMGGWLFAWKGRRDPEEERMAVGAAAALGMRPAPVQWVGPFAGSRNRHIHSYEKVAPCPPGFPRRPGMARKRPLGVLTTSA